MSSVRVATVITALLMSSPVIAQERQSLIDPSTYRGLSADQRAYRVGDLLTVYVLEATRAKSQAATDASSNLDMDAGLSSPSTNYQATLGLSGRNAGGAQTTRVGELRAQISAQVIEVAPSGLLRIEGIQSLVVNGERQKIRLKGFVRPEDIASDNTIVSTRIANADLELVGAGVVSESQRQSILYRLTKWLRLL
jgi:flagellar L-ring protein FlgH